MKLAPDPSSRSSVHWTVRMNRRNRTIFYPLLFLALGSHLLVTDAPGWTWVLLALNYLVFPQAAYWRARHAVDPLRAEMQNLDTDVVLFGLWAGILASRCGSPSCWSHRAASTSWSSTAPEGVFASLWELPPALHWRR